MQLAGVGSGCTVAQLQESVWRGGVGTLGAGNYTLACLGVRKALPVSRSFLELASAHLHSLGVTMSQKSSVIQIASLVP